MATRPPTRAFTLIFSLLACMANPPADVLSMEAAPFLTFNQSPVIQIFGIPATGNATVLPRGGSSAQLVLDVSNNFTDAVSGTESIVLDGERWRTTLAFGYGIGSNLEIGLEIPVITTWAGILNEPVQWWHKTFGIEQNGRDDVPEGRVLFTYSRDGRERFRVDRSRAGIGDIRISGGMQLYRDREQPRQGMTLRTSIKVPTGESAELRGSGAPDLALWLTGNEGIPLLSDNWAILYGLGGMVVGRGDLMPELQRELVGFGTFGLFWSPSKRYALKAQLDGNTPFYRNSALKELDSTSIQLVAGGTVGFSETTTLDISFSEDLLTVSSSPDFGVTLALKTVF